LERVWEEERVMDSKDVKCLERITPLELMEVCRMAVACAYCGSSDGRKRLITIMNAEGNEERSFVCAEGPCSSQPITRFN
jgi:hypothetical protein